MEGILEYRAKHKLLFEKKNRQEYLKNKYAQLIELDPIRCAVGRIVKFVKKYLLIAPINIDSAKISEISGIFRFRCYVYDIDCELSSIQETFSSQIEAISCCDEDYDVKQIMKESLAIDKNILMQQLLESNSMIKYPVMLDLQIYGIDPNAYVFFNDNKYIIDDFTRIKMINIYNRVNPYTLTGEKFIQMLNHSKALCLSFIKSKVAI
jgi:hypothetical protein